MWNLDGTARNILTGASSSQDTHREGASHHDGLVVDARMLEFTLAAPSAARERRTRHTGRGGDVTDYADLEIGLHRRDWSNWRVGLRYSQPRTAVERMKEHT